MAIRLLHSFIPYFLTGIGLLSGAPQLSSGLKATGDENLLHALVRVGQANGIALGIVRPNDGILCQIFAGTVPDSQPEVTSVDQIAKQAGYQVLHLEGVTVVKPQKMSGRLDEVLGHRYESFPEINGTMQYMGGVLQGWMDISFNGAMGFALSSGSATNAQSLRLEKSSRATIIQVAGRIVSLETKGVWVLSEEEPTQSGHPVRISVATYSYKDDIQSLDHLPCPIPLVKPTGKPE